MAETDDRPVMAVRLDTLFKTVRPKGRHWTNAEVAEELKRANPDLKVGGVYLSQLRTGKRSNPSPDLLAAVARFFGVLLGSGRRFDLLPTRANGQPAFGAYLRTPADGIRHGTGLYSLTLAGERISAMVRFESSVLPAFGLPPSLPGRRG